jgi:hypothetical protein
MTCTKTMTDAKVESLIKFADKMATEYPLGGKKNDQSKPMMALLTPEFLEETAKVLTFGAAKYEKYNWAKGMSWSRPFGALMRHAWAWWGGQDKDPETGLSHLAHCACNVLFLLHYEKFKKGEDDRYHV